MFRYVIAASFILPVLALLSGCSPSPAPASLVVRDARVWTGQSGQSAVRAVPPTLGRGARRIG